jgi:oligopeptide transport system substrate-binding protein
MFKQGQLDYLAVLRSDVTAVKGDAMLSKQLVTVPRPVVFYIGMNQNLYKPFQNPKVRKAFAMAIDRDRIANDLLNGVPVAHGLIAHEVPGYRTDYKGLPFNPTEAKRLLAEAGYPGGKGLPPLEISYRESSPDARVVVEGVHSSLKQNLAFPARLRAVDGSVFLKRRNAGEFAGWFLSWGADYPDPQNFTTFLLLSDSPMNFEKYRNTEFDRVGKLADATVDQAKRLELYQQGEDVLIQDVARVPLYYGQDNILVSSRLKGLRMNLMGTLPHTNVTVN